MKDLNEKIIPFFKANRLLTYKKNDFETFCKAVEMKLLNLHLTINGIQNFRDLKNPQRLIRRTLEGPEKIESELHSDM